MAPLGLTADANHNGSPISLLWAHQLRREHAAIVAQLDELKRLYPPSAASELDKLVARTERAEAAYAEIRKELVALKGAQQETVRGLEGLEGRREEEMEGGKEREERFRVEIEGLKGLLMRQGGQLSALVDAVRKVQRRVEERRDGVVEQKLLRNEEEISELRRLVQALEQRVGDAVTVVRDSVGCRDSDEGPPAAVPPPPAEDVSDAESFDLDANVPLVAPAAASGPVLGPSLAMIKEPTLPRHSQRLRPHQQPEKMGDSMAMLPEPSLPPLPPQQPLMPKTRLPAPQVAKPDINLIQGRSALSAYIQIADSQFEDTPPAAEAVFVDAFVHGLRDKRDRKKCDKKFRDGVKTWEGLKECFPVASQISQKAAKRKGELHVRKRRVVNAMETRAAAGGGPMPSACESGMENGGEDAMEVGDIRDGDPVPSAARKRMDIRKGQAPPSARAEQNNNEAKQDARDAGNAQAGADSTAAAAAARKRPLAERKTGQVESTRDEAEPAAKRRRTKKRGARRPRERPQIPILPSSDDEFSRRCRRR
ncbi:hypothetical protein EPUS_06706 [Endocarpon pusillum Z07020]|uniref:Uncharacterized protein n=1 Tax=Endocarpon pusillum (strain Z07020 / HMAS-L-300199) TaxID=1263415 RepID=U1HJC0_ENDPU|nr:uncharacterized protein EPUS_06706 [Endocarpon pusillum Z07020]ERF69019.1 hypothetical protein EPUS_06706 [Endocarpon pusillum Z07020]